MSRSRRPERTPFERAVIWLHFLRVVPDDHTKFNNSIEELARQYKSLVSDHNLSDWHLIYCARMVRADNSQLPEDESLMKIIHGDVIRTGKPICFLHPQVDPNVCDEHPDDALSAFSEHMRRLERALYIFGKVNLTISYMQGFNELIVPIYYVMNKGLDVDLDTCEAISFFTLQRLITSTGLGELYNVHTNGKVAFEKMDEFESILQQHLPKVASHLQMLEVPPMQYAYRWLSLLFGQEYDIPNLVGLWDALMEKGSNLMDFAYYIGVSQIEDLADQLLATKEVSEILSILHKRPDIVGIAKMIERAEAMWNEDRGRRQSERGGKHGKGKK